MSSVVVTAIGGTATMTGAFAVRLWAMFDGRGWVQHVADVSLAIAVIGVVALLVERAAGRVIAHINETEAGRIAAAYAEAVDMSESPSRVHRVR